MIYTGGESAGLEAIVFDPDPRRVDDQRREAEDGVQHAIEAVMAGDTIVAAEHLRRALRARARAVRDSGDPRRTAEWLAWACRQVWDIGSTESVQVPGLLTGAGVDQLVEALREVPDGDRVRVRVDETAAFNGGWRVWGRWV